MSKRAQDRYWAVQGQDHATCEALRWAWTSVRPYVVATGAEEPELLDWAVSLTGNSDIYVRDSEGDDSQ